MVHLASERRGHGLDAYHYGAQIIFENVRAKAAYQVIALCWGCEVGIDGVAQPPQPHLEGLSSPLDQPIGVHDERRAMTQLYGGFTVSSVQTDPDWRSGVELHDGFFE